MEYIVKTITEFGTSLIEEQHEFFAVDGSVDNSEHVYTLKRIADVACAYLNRKGVTPNEVRKVYKELINHGKDLFEKEWMKTEEGEEPLDEEDRLEARETFDELMKENTRYRDRDTHR